MMDDSGMFTADDINWAGTPGGIATPQRPDNDECALCRSEMCEGHDKPHPPDDDTLREPTGSRLTFFTAAQMMEMRPAEHIVAGIIAAEAVTVLVAESGTGKTFVMLNMAACITSAVDWQGRRTKNGSVAHVSFEADALGKRLRAIRQHQGHRLDHLYGILAVDPISPRTSRDGDEQPSCGERDLVAVLECLVSHLAMTHQPPVVLLIIDTVRASLAGSEDNSVDVAAYLRAVRRLLTVVPGAGAVLLHHSGWQDGQQQRKRERGSSAWRGNADGTLYLEESSDADKADRSEVRLTLKVLKVRDDDPGPPMHLIRRRVYLNEPDRDGQPVDSCIIDRDTRTSADRAAERATAVTTAQEVLDRKVLQTMRAHRPTSVAMVRQFVGARQNLVADAVGRVLDARLASKKGTRQPYQLPMPASRS